MDVGKDTALGDGDVAEKFVQFFVIANGKLKMTGDNSGLFVVTCSVSGQFEDLSS